MEFLNPIFLWFLPLVVLPIILNIFYRHSQKTIPFPLYFLLVKGEKGKGISFKQILKILIRMLIILTLIAIFLHPVKQKNRKRVIFFDNSIHSSILDEKSVPIFYRGIKILKGIYQKGDKIITLAENGFKSCNSIDNIKIINREFDLKIPKNITKDFTVIMISPFTQRFDIASINYDTFPKKFENIGMDLIDFSILKSEIAVRIYNQGEEREVSIIKEKGENSITLFRGKINKNSQIDLTLNTNLKGAFDLFLSTIDKKNDSYLIDNRIELHFPEKFTVNLEYSNKYIENLFGSISKKIVFEKKSSGMITVSDKLYELPGIYFIKNGISNMTNASFTLQGDFIPFKVKGKDLNIRGKTIIEGENGERFAVLNENRLVFGFLPEPDYINIIDDENGGYLFLLSIDKFLKNYVMDKNHIRKNKPIEHYTVKNKDISNEGTEKRIDYRALLLLFFILLLIVEIFF